MIKLTETIVSKEISSTKLTLSYQTGKLALQADGAVVGRIGDTMVLVTATCAKSVREGIDFFPLTVDIEERMYAAGKIPGSFFRREGRATDQAILTCRLIDRPLRPSFPDGFRSEVHIVGTIFGADQENPHDVLAINTASAALMISGIPFEGPIGAVRIAYSVDGKWIAHPSYQAGDESTFELVVAGRALDTDSNSDIAIMMVEAGGTEKSWQYYEAGAPKVTEEVIAQGLEEAKIWIRESIELQRELVAKAGKPNTLDIPLFVDYEPDVMEKVREIGESSLVQANSITDKAERKAQLDEVESKILEQLSAEFEGQLGQVKSAIKSLTKKIVRERIVNDNVRIDGRDTTSLRPLSSEVGLIPTAHGSGLFQRGDTQVLNITTLGMPRMNQLLDTIGIDDTKRYMHHYNFPPFSTGETGAMRGPKRREIGHGLLAERALLPVIPPEDEFPYTLRLVSEVLSSNGSTSMASVCGSSLSLMDAGVPIKAPVAGIAMGLVYESGKYTTLTDILGAEDAFGDMDFKVAGTRECVTALQLDTKIDGLPAEVLSRALQQAKDARLKILDVMESAISTPRQSVNLNAPKIVSLKIPLDKVGEVIGPKGKVINTIQQETGADISVDDDGEFGTVVIGSKESSAVEDALARIELIINPPTPEIGATYQGTVVNLTKFGAFINILPGRDGLLHISKLGSGGRRVERAEDVLDMGQVISVKVDDIDPGGKVSLVLESALETAPANRSGSTESSSASHERKSTNYVSFEEEFEKGLVEEFGDLGPQGAESSAPRSRRPDSNRSRPSRRRSRN